jgi:hypothetical protein
VEKRFSIVIAALLIISLAMWTYSTRERERSAMQVNTPEGSPAPSAGRPLVPEPTPPPANDVREASPPPAPQQQAVPAVQASSKPVTVARRPTPKQVAAPTPAPAISAIPVKEASVRDPAPDISPPAPSKPAMQSARARLGIVGTGYYTLVYDKTVDRWYECDTPTWDLKGMSCAGLKDFSELLPALAADDSESEKLVSIQRFDGRNVVNYVYLASGPSGAGFYIATLNPTTGRYSSSGEKFSPSNAKKKGVDMKNALSVQFNQAGLVPAP